MSTPSRPGDHRAGWIIRPTTAWPLAALQRLVDGLQVERRKGLFLTDQGWQSCNQSDWAAIAATKQAVSIPVIANGDISSTADARTALAQSGADGVMVGRGTGVDDQGLARKKKVIADGMEINKPDSADGVDILAKVGGFEIGGIAGLILAAAYYRHPVVIDGFISTAGALVAQAISPHVVDYMFAGHQSEEPGHKIMLRHLGLDPILDLGMRLGEGTGGAMAMSVIDGAVKVFNEVLTFEEASVPGKND